ncbi:Dynamin, GTPase domain protein [Metarhizium album ARSEF 1941]|uniref:Dynamin, GTPase domain protein n=1 Tax=Metarhizium album (strain ARSEF 1941) TaxID=1081103 RepID=A0A0B2WE71_METAS|nr:Dynamin, GTPase domain protein [Metarhizium album ARSEF 1941]KHN94156.1 Dynamin, GTPase domain protein [Metarhizium album ARSEF 1941]
MPGTGGTQGAKALTSPDRLHKIDQLREKNVGAHMPLPQLVVVGDQSSGKSSLLESLTGIPFPNGQGLCTRYATQITHRRDAVQAITITIIPGPDAADEEKERLKAYQETVESTDELVTRFESILTKHRKLEANAAMGIRNDLNPEGVRTFSQDVLKIEKCGPAEDYLTVIDVPGIFRNTEEGVTTESDKRLVLDMVKSYIEQERTVILAVLPSTVDIMTQEILNLAERFDQSGERTLGVLTKPDLLTERSTKAVVCDLVNGKKRPLNLGYYVVRNRGADEDSEDSQSFREREAMFKQEPWCHLPPDRVGIVALRERLQELLGHITDRAFPKLRAQARKMLDACKKELDDLGFSRQTEREQQQYLCDIAGQFQTVVRDALGANYTSNETLESDELRLITDIVNMTDEFNQEFSQLSQSRFFQPVASADDGESDDGRRAHGERHHHVNEPDASKFPELDSIIDTHWTPEQPEGDIMGWINRIYHRSRGADLTTFGPGLLLGAFREQSNKWAPFVKLYMSKVILIIHRFVMTVLARVCPDPRVLDELQSALDADLRERYQAGMDQALFLVSIERDMKPYTLNQAFSRELQRLRSLRISDKLGEDFIDRFDRKVVYMDKVKSELGGKNNVKYTEEDIHDILQVYYDIARERFVDYVYRLAVDNCLLSGPTSPLSLFSEKWVLALQTQSLASIAGESLRVTGRRDQLNKKMQDLQSAIEILR